MVMAGLVPAIPVLSRRSDFKTEMAGTSPAMTVVNTIGCEEVTANSYFFAGAILESAGLAASGLASVFAASAWSMRSTLAVSRSFAT
jgi:hypothetical protein